ncbi:MAG: putative rane protein [Mucilaginibacter sp.]|nr:putative rane protein [Mucilaginibacter sp.]
MELKVEKPFFQALGIGILAGMRSASAPAITGYILSHHQSKTFAKSRLGFLQSNAVANGLKYIALAEFIGDNYHRPLTG